LYGELATTPYPIGERGGEGGGRLKLITLLTPQPIVAMKPKLTSEHFFHWKKR
jgi:hypothetical protein